MKGEIVLNDWNPSEQTLRYWAYNEHVLLDEQEEDLVLHREAYLPLLLEFADDPVCPKAHSILAALDHFLMYLVLRGADLHVETVKKAVVLAKHAKSSIVIEWRKRQERRLRHRLGGAPIDREQAMSAAHDLLIGSCRVATLAFVDDNPLTWEIELSVPPFSVHRERLSFDKVSGTFRFRVGS